MNNLPTTEGVEFKLIRGFLEYAVGDDGTVWSNRKKPQWQRLCKKTRNRERRPCVHLCSDNINKGYLRKLVCVAVLEAFHGPQPEGTIAYSIDGDYLNNASSNLMWRERQGDGTLQIENELVPVYEDGLFPSPPLDTGGRRDTMELSIAMNESEASGDILNECWKVRPRIDSRFHYEPTQETIASRAAFIRQFNNKKWECTPYQDTSLETEEEVEEEVCPFQ